MSEEKKNGEIVMGETEMKKEFIPPVRKREDIYYSNMVGITTTLYDMRFDFCRRPSSKEEQVVSDVTVMMSPQHAKEMLVVMIKTLGEYERQHGKIPSDYDVSASVHPKNKEEPKPFPPQKLDDLN